jgi:flagellar basal-body rod protein FlgB
MFIDRLVNGGNVPLIQQMLEFTVARHRLIAENIANIDNVNYRQKDLSLERFQEMLRQSVEERNRGTPGAIGLEEIKAELAYPRNGILFHDGNNRSIEHLVTDQAKNAMMHQIAVELLRKQFGQMEMALRERVV